MGDDGVETRYFFDEGNGFRIVPVLAIEIGGESCVQVDGLPPVVDLAAGATAFGETIPLGEDWTFSLVTVADGVAERLMSEFGEDPPEGSTHAVIVYEATYSGADEVASDPFIVQGLGSAVYDGLMSLCSVDGAAAADAYGTTVEFEFPPGETYRQAVCITVPQSEVAGLVVKADNVFDFEADPVRFSG
jgi:hypothetical protein